MLNSTQRDRKFRTYARVRVGDTRIIRVIGTRHMHKVGDSIVVGFDCLTITNRIFCDIGIVLEIEDVPEPNRAKLDYFLHNGWDLASNWTLYEPLDRYDDRSEVSQSINITTPSKG